MKFRINLIFIILFHISNITHSFYLISSLIQYRADKNPTINYLNYLNSLKPVPIYSKNNLIKKTTYDDIFLNICDNNICEFIMDNNVTKLIVKYNNGLCKIYYNTEDKDNDNNINKLIQLYLMNLNNRIYFSSLDENEEKYYYEK